MPLSLKSAPEVIMYLQGGLGNQLFQYAMGRRLSLVNNAALALDISWFGGAGQEASQRGDRRFGLDHFRIVGTILKASPKGASDSTWVSRKYAKYLGKLRTLLEAGRPYYSRATICEPEERHFRFDDRLQTLRVRGRVRLCGFWQTEKYFRDIKDVIRRELTVREPLEGWNAQLAENIAACESVAVHIRHGDNAIIGSGFGLLSQEYLREALRRIRERVTDPHLFVFSDDMAWARGTLQTDLPVVYVDHNGDERNYEDLRLMSLCRHQIIANSTFSWWAAWLGERTGQIVYAPARYYQNIDRPNPDLYPENWNLIEAR